MSGPIDPEKYRMRRACECGSEIGYVVERNGQDTVRCVNCDRFQYNAPRVETGREVRSVSTVHEAIRPKQRARILNRGALRCEVCGSRGRLHVAHLISVSAGLNYGLTETELNHDENLLCLCEECNLGMGPEPMPLRVAIAVLRARLAWVASKESP